MIVLWMLERVWDLWRDGRLPEVCRFLHKLLLAIVFVASRILPIWIPGLILGRCDIHEDFARLLLRVLDHLTIQLRAFVQHRHRHWARNSAAPFDLGLGMSEFVLLFMKCNRILISFHPFEDLESLV